MTPVSGRQTRFSLAGLNSARDVSFGEERESIRGLGDPCPDTPERVRAAIGRARRESEGLSRTALPEQSLPGSSPALHSRESGQHADPPIPRFPLFPPIVPPSRPLPSFHALQEWEGYVTDIGAENFHARLVDITAGASIDGEEARIPLAEVSDEDAGRMQCGSIFRWVIGYERSMGGARKRVSQIVFRDLPALTRKDIRDGQAWAQEVLASPNS